MRKENNDDSICKILYPFGAAFARTGVWTGGLRTEQEGPVPASSDVQNSERRPNCPTCGMYADMTPEWQATIKYNDGSVLYFDVPEHMLAFYLDPTEHEATETQKNLNTQITVGLPKQVFH